MKTHMLFVQTGDYSEAWHRFRSGGEETFRDQKASVDYVESLSRGINVTVLARCGRDHDEVLLPGLRSIGVDATLFYDRRRLRQLLGSLAPDRVCLRMPDWYVVSWLARRQVPCLPIFADNFSNSGLREALRNMRLAFWLRRLNKPCVSNHSLNASLALRRLGLGNDDIVPWDRTPIPQNDDPKSSISNRPARLLFVGAISEDKGVGDCLRALGVLNSSVERFHLSLIGQGEIDKFEKLAQTLGVADAVRFLGRISNAEVRAAMRRHDIVLVPSRHTYPEGLPNTLVEGLASGTPVVASDHPAFANRLEHGKGALLFKAGDAGDLASKVVELADDPARYHGVSLGSREAMAGLAFGTVDIDLINLFLDDPSGRSWKSQRSLAALLKDA